MKLLSTIHLACALAAILSGYQARAEVPPEPLGAAAEQVVKPFNPEAEPAAETDDPEDEPGSIPYNPEADSPPVITSQGGAGSGLSTPPMPGELTPPKSAEPLPEILCDGETVCREPDTGLPSRVLARAFSKSFAGPADDAAVVRESIPALTPLYVFARQGMDLSDPTLPIGWYQVSEAETGPPLGWLRAADAVEWRQALVVSFTHPGAGQEARQRVLMFKHLDDLRALTDSDERETQARAIYSLIEQGRPPGAIVSRESERFANISRGLYLLPIVDHQLIDIAGDEVRYLRLAAAVPEARGADDLRDPEFREQVLEKPVLDADAKKSLNVDLVFIMDMTRSMQPYLDHTREAIVELASNLISKQGLDERVRFGLVGYRDSVAKIPALELTAKSFTPELLSADDFIALVKREAVATSIGSLDYAEEVYAGVDRAIESTAWRDNALRFLVLVGDASAHEPLHEQSTTKKDAPTLRLALNDRSLYFVAMHLKDYRMGSDHPIAESQLRTLAKVPGSEKSAYYEVPIGAEPDYKPFQEKVTSITTDLLSFYAERTAAATPDGGGAEPVEPPSKNEEPPSAMADLLLQSALVDYLGRDARPPNDILVWALDRDLVDTRVRSLEVRVLINKEQLSSLIQALDRVLGAMRKQQQEQIKLFEALQSVTTATMKNPEAIATAQQLVDTGLLPRFIASLPYRSAIQSLTEDSYASLTADQRAELESSLLSKLQQYRDINETLDGWVKLNAGDDDAKKVYPLHLDYLP